MKKDENKYILELTQKQLMELLWWHDSDMEKWKKKGVKDQYLTVQEKNPLRTYIESKLRQGQFDSDESTVVNKIQGLIKKIASARKSEAL